VKQSSTGQLVFVECAYNFSSYSCYLSYEYATQDPEARKAFFLKFFIFFRECISEYDELKNVNGMPCVFYFFKSIAYIHNRRLADKISEFLSSQILSTLKCFEDIGIDLSSVTYQGIELIQFIVGKSTPLSIPCIEYLALEKHISIQKIDFNFRSGGWSARHFEKLQEIKCMQNEYLSGSFKKPRISKE
jgi:hypothetical protein